MSICPISFHSGIVILVSGIIKNMAYKVRGGIVQEKRGDCILVYRSVSATRYESLMHYIYIIK